jgi:hypothetical protein
MKAILGLDPAADLLRLYARIASVAFATGFFGYIALAAHL